MKLEKQEIAVWVKSSDEFPKDESLFYTIRKNGKYSIATFSKTYGWEFVHNGKIAKDVLLYEWLKPAKDVYVLTEDELSNVIAGFVEEVIKSFNTKYPVTAQSFLESLTK